jgi:hypothetical protein
MRHINFMILHCLDKVSINREVLTTSSIYLSNKRPRGAWDIPLLGFEKELICLSGNFRIDKTDSGVKNVPDSK